MLRETPVEMSIHFYSNAALFGKAFALVCFVVCIYYSWLFWLKLCIYVGHLESCWEWTVVAFVTETTRFGFGKNRVWYFCRHEISKMQKNWRSQHPPLFFVWWSKLMKQRTPTACHSHCLPIIVSYKPLLTSIIQILNINLCHINFRTWWTSINHILTIY